MKRRIFVTLCLILIVARLAACNNAAISPVVIDTPPAAEPPPETAPTAAPQMRVLTATPTPNAPTATPTSIPRPASPTPTLTATPTPHIYVVRQYDTLLGIAVEFNTTIEALVAANDLNENDFLQIGQKLIIPTSAEAAIIAAAPVTPTVTVSVDAATPTTPVTTTVTVVQPSSPEVQAAANPTAALPASTPAATAPTTAASTSSLPAISHPTNINPLTGLPVDDPAKLQRRPLMVRVGNDPAARPQVGLNSADMVYEEITEWWVTRFTAIFLAETP
ncbi:MAG: DUF3048 domain-containing protein, partial [Dehalococcoidia bacterium]